MLDRNIPHIQLVASAQRRVCSGVLVGLVAFLVIAFPARADEPTGQQLAHDVYKGNCLACHQIPRDPTAISRADIGPPLVDIRSRFPERSTLRSQIWDSTVRNAQTVMPPFGKHKVLTEHEIDLIVDYISQY